MSYILDALKRAEAERNNAAAARGALPGAFVAPPAARTSRAPLLLVLGLLAGAGIGTFALDALRSPAARPAPASPVTTGHTARMEASAQREVEARMQSGEVAVAESHPRLSPAPALIIPPAPPPRPSVKTGMPAPPGKATPAATSSARSAPAPSVQARPLGTLRDLPDHIQREIPPLTVAGFLYSDNPADRSVLINQRLRREGDEVAPGLVLEALRPNGMVFNYRGHRYRSTY